jgi:hypothetical protein
MHAVANCLRQAAMLLSSAAAAGTAQQMCLYELNCCVDIKKTVEMALGAMYGLVNVKPGHGTSYGFTSPAPFRGAVRL